MQREILSLFNEEDGRTVTSNSLTHFLLLAKVYKQWHIRGTEREREGEREGKEEKFVQNKRSIFQYRMYVTFKLYVILA